MRIIGSGNPYTSADEQWDRVDWRRFERQLAAEEKRTFMARNPHEWLEVAAFATATGIDEKCIETWVKRGDIDFTRQGNRKATFVNVGSVQRLYRERGWV